MLVLYRDSQGHLPSSGFYAALDQAQAAAGTVQVIVPSSLSALNMQRTLADDGLGVGIEVTTIIGFARQLWSRFGDGTHVATTSHIRALAWWLMKQGQSGLPNLPGNAALVTSVVTQIAPSLVDEAIEHPRFEDRLSIEQTHVFDTAQTVHQMLAERGLSSLARVYQELPGALAQAPDQLTVVFAGFFDLTPLELAFVAELAACANVYWIQSAPEGPAGAAARTLAHALVEAVEKNTQLRAVDMPPQRRVSKRTDALEHFLDRVYRQAGALGASESFMLLEAAGPEAEAELVARTLTSELALNWECVLVVAKDLEATWRVLAPKLASRYLLVRADWTQEALSLRQVHLFLGFARQIARIAAVARTWPNPPQTTGPNALALDAAYTQALRQSVASDRGWWPPRAVVDYLFAGPLGIDVGKVYALDNKWRRLRTLTPAAVMSDLRVLGAGKPAFLACLDHLEKGDIARAAESLLELAAQSRSREAHQALMAVAEVAYEVQELLDQVGVQPELAPASLETLLNPSAEDREPREVTIFDELQVIAHMLEERFVHRTPECVRPDATFAAEVTILSPREAANVAPESYDAVLVLSQTDTQSPLEHKEDTASVLFEAIDQGPVVPEVMVARARMWATWSAATSCILMERALHDEQAAETQPSPYLADFLEVFNQELPAERWDERQFARNVSADGLRPGYTADGTFDAHETELPSADVMSRKSAKLLLANRNIAAGTPVVSATAIESYLTCPRRWNFESGLRAHDIDAAITPLARGNLVHKTLEIAYRAHYKGNRAEDKLRLASQIQDAFEELVIQGAAGLDPGASMMPHALPEELELEALKLDLCNFAESPFSSFEGFRPTFFEFGFGDNESPIELGGARLIGMIDRIDVGPNGELLIVDYKSLSRSRAAEYDLVPANADPATWEPRHIQGLLYAWAAPQLPAVQKLLGRKAKAKGAVYLKCIGELDVRGAVAPDTLGAVFGPPSTKWNRADPSEVGLTFDELLERACERAREAIHNMMAGHIEPRPINDNVCRSCPVVSCERRRS